MRYFTRGWANGDLDHDDDDDASERVVRAYSARLALLRPDMPPELESLATAISLHDGLIESASWAPADRRLTLDLAYGDNARGYFTHRLSYLGVQISSNSIDLFAERVRDRRTVILYDEVDRDDDGDWVHRILLHPVGEFCVWFTSIESVRVPCSGKQLGALGYDPFTRILPEGDPEH